LLPRTIVTNTQTVKLAFNAVESSIYTAALWSECL